MPLSSHRSPPQAAPAAASPPTSVADNRLGLSAQDVAVLRQHQQLAHSQARSSAGSQASSQGRLLLDPGSLQLLSRHFDRVMQAISQRLEQLNRATETATQAQHDRSGNAIQMADNEIARFRAILQQIDELETEFDKIKRIREIVRGFRARVEHLERRIG
ncbi:hypothetical protein CLAFUW4_00610 [Fulvia fulva]|uniref:Biogenesis of lysosome-related organelles complex 1 subunit CNL1 n=1 Tax=Passalora fulva TaxID=5499 RepID=A0A9Q8L757_PASFU|nr:uncharacterized protein CLAFUR5_00609 [Fulvia fulva]KAK4634109.1 hypothetical protein CLAFUR4_00611 [Fulvia fulva]KAK4637939.1 hypothetical protein CLAFUR0_00612 [Fulvia fulva]UJO12055.1 hypothetical protein CLAFUR5_00609 [Fulvia fulva]WPV09720.1 hypothetical protein CLAFUW4_00610 [Fulvia fulva]WPV24543.1 hypothetical protein CLAFUW7_00615 [Fulvia fulva]